MNMTGHNCQETQFWPFCLTRSAVSDRCPHSQGPYRTLPPGGEGQLKLVPSRPVPLSSSYRLNRGIPLLRNVPTHLSYIVHSWTWTKVFTVGLTMSLDNWRNAVRGIFTTVTHRALGWKRGIVKTDGNSWDYIYYSCTGIFLGFVPARSSGWLWFSSGYNLIRNLITLRDIAW